MMMMTARMMLRNNDEEHVRTYDDDGYSNDEEDDGGGGGDDADDGDGVAFVVIYFLNPIYFPINETTYVRTYGTYTVCYTKSILAGSMQSWLAALSPEAPWWCRS